METIQTLFIPKRFNNYADTFLLLGLARLLTFALSQTHQKTDLQLLDAGTCYCIYRKQPLNLEAIAQLAYADPFLPVCGRNTDRSAIPDDATIFDAVEQAQIRRQYLEARSQGKIQRDSGDPILPPDPKTQNGITLTSMRSEKNHNDLWLAGRNLEAHYGALLVALIEGFSQSLCLSEDLFSAIADRFYERTQVKLPSSASAIKIYLPTAVEGVSRVKADNNKTDRKKADWLMLWLIAHGFFVFGVSESVKVADKYDRRVLALEPQDIRFSKYCEVLDRFRQLNTPSGSHGVARFDAELVLRFCLELLQHHQAEAVERPEDDLELCQPINHFVSGFAGTGFGSKGQVYGVKELFRLGLPGWVQPSTYDELQSYQTLLQEHLAVVRSLSAESGHSELLAAYRDFITGNSLRLFFPFQVSYADYIVRQLADSHARSPRLFSVSGLNLMTQKDASFQQITQDPSFLRIAKAINQATVFAGKVRTQAGVIELDWQRNYGLAQRLSSQSGSKKEFLSAIADFLAKYEAENLRLTEQLQNRGQSLRRIWTTKEDLDRLVELVEAHDTVLVANLLIAYGYARWTKAKETSAEDAVEPEELPNAIADLETTETTDLE
jgi:hypothetical protein